MSMRKYVNLLLDMKPNQVVVVSIASADAASNPKMPDVGYTCRTCHRREIFAGRLWLACTSI